MRGYAIGIMAGLLLLSGSAFAGSAANGEPPGRRGHREPPPEAYEACQGKSEGIQVEITTPRGDKMKAKCKVINGKLAAVPEGGPGGRRMPPPFDQGDGRGERDESGNE